MPHSPILLWTSGSRDLADPVDLDFLADLHPAWSADVRSFRIADSATAATPSGLVPLAHGEGEAPSGADAPQTILCGPCTSTFEVARHLFELPGLDPQPFMGILAPSQRSGRGQLRRPWFSPPGNLFCTFAWPQDDPLPPGLTPLAAGLVAARGLGMLSLALSPPLLALQPDALRLKWPNDLLLTTGGVDRKVGGILVEARAKLVLVGMGLNLEAAPDDTAMRQERAAPAGILPAADPDRPAGPLRIWTELAPRMRAAYRALTALSQDEVVHEVEQRLAWRGRMVRVGEGDGTFRGLLVGLAEDGGLRVNGPDGVVVVHNGPVVLA